MHQLSAFYLLSLQTRSQRFTALLNASPPGRLNLTLVENSRQNYVEKSLYEPKNLRYNGGVIKLIRKEMR